MRTRVDAETLRRWFAYASASLHEQREHLTQLDAAIGDADQGTNMDRGFTVVVAKLHALEAATPREILIVAGTTLMSSVGGTSGALWGTALRRAGAALGDAGEIDTSALARTFEAALASVIELGGAEEGDKTMVDALAPATRALREQAERGATPAVALAAARAAAEEGMHATTPLQARKGRASYLGERSIGHQDPGATATVLIVAALERAVSDTVDHV
ncbi:MAG: dihydroxyacetone kinase subunit DhaL [Dehalococcoidia bacterium]